MSLAVRASSLFLCAAFLLGCETPPIVDPSAKGPFWSFSPPPQGVYGTRVGVSASADPEHDVYLSVGGNPTTSGTVQVGPFWLGERKTWSLNWSTPVGSGWDRVRSTTYRLDPARPQAAVGADHSLVINSTTLYAWGNDDNGQLGQGSLHFDGIPSPTVVSHSEAVLAAWAMGDSSMFLDEAGELWVFGSGPWFFGETQAKITVPQRVPLAEGVRVKTAALGEFGGVWAVDSLGQLWVWGSNFGGTFGAGDPNDEVRVPVKVLDSVALVVAGPYHTLVLKNDGSVLVAGLHDSNELGSGTMPDIGNRYNRLGTGSSTGDALVWTSIGTWPDIYSLGTAPDHSWFLTASGDFWAWGSNAFGQLPGVDAETQRVDVPTKMATHVAAAAGSTRYTLVLGETGPLTDYGSAIKPFPALTAADGVRFLLASDFHALALTGGFHDYNLDPWASMLLWGEHLE